MNRVEIALRARRSHNPSVVDTVRSNPRATVDDGLLERIDLIYNTAEPDIEGVPK